MEGNLPAPQSPPARRRETARGNLFVRALGWTIGLAVMVGTLLLVVVAVTQPAPQEIAQAAKPVRKCPPDVSVPSRAIGFPVDDVVGVRPGMNARDIEETVKCVSEDYAIETQALTRGLAGSGAKSRPLVVATRGQETLSFALFGPAGAEQVASSWRTVYFDAGQGPPMSNIEGLLTGHYGAPHEARTTPEGVRIFTWTYAPDGRALRVRPAEGDIMGMAGYMANGWTVAACVKHAHLDPTATLAWDGRCGLTIRAEIDPSLSDRTRIARWRLVLLDQPTLARVAAPLRAMGAEPATP